MTTEHNVEAEKLAQLNEISILCAGLDIGYVIQIQTEGGREWHIEVDCAHQAHANKLRARLNTRGYEYATRGTKTMVYRSMPESMW